MVVAHSGYIFLKLSESLATSSYSVFTISVLKLNRDIRPLNSESAFQHIKVVGVSQGN